MTPNPTAANNPAGTVRNLARARRRSPLFDRVVATTGACSATFRADCHRGKCIDFEATA